jgi:hypothetical protein
MKAFISQRSMSNGFIYVVDAHFIDKIEENKYPGPKCLWINLPETQKQDNSIDWIIFFGQCS